MLCDISKLDYYYATTDVGRLVQYSKTGTERIFLPAIRMMSLVISLLQEADILTEDENLFGSAIVDVKGHRYLKSCE